MAGLIALSCRCLAQGLGNIDEENREIYALMENGKKHPETIRGQMRTNKFVSFLSFALVKVPFALTAKALLQMGKVFHLSYNAVNIIVWYMLLPLAWAAILDYKLHQLLFAPTWLLLCLGCIFLQRKRFGKFCDTLFKLSQVFILSFGDYCLWSVLICLLVPVVITAVLLIA